MRTEVSGGDGGGGSGRRGGGGLSSEKREIVELEIGKYNPYLGTSYTEIAARSRSMHKSQGFGRAGSRGGQLERLVLLEGAAAEGDFLNGVDTSWKRFPDGEKLNDLIEKAIGDFDFAAPWKTVPELAKLDALMEALPESKLMRLKRASFYYFFSFSYNTNLRS